MSSYTYHGAGRRYDEKTRKHEGIVIRVATPGGTLREVPLTVRQAMFAIKELSDALIGLETEGWHPGKERR